MKRKSFTSHRSMSPKKSEKGNQDDKLRRLGKLNDHFISTVLVLAHRVKI